MKDSRSTQPNQKGGSSRPAFEFVKAAIRSPREVSTVFPTSKALANKLLDHASLVTASKVVELGPGSGAITQQLALRLEKSGAFLGIELDPRLCEVLRAEFPQLRFEQGRAEDLLRWTEPKSIDSIVSSLPWTVFPEVTRKSTIDAIYSSLKPGGVFVTYICVNAMVYPSAKSFISQLKAKFQSVQRSSLEMRNIPPAFVFRAVK